MSRSKINIEPFGERALLVRLSIENGIENSARAANIIADGLRAEPHIEDAVAGIDSVALRFNPALTTSAEICERINAFVNSDTLTSKSTAQETIDIPVCYGGDYGPDLDMVAVRCKTSVDAIIQHHTSISFPVLTIGFAPGFAYVGPIPAAIEVPRRDTPRLHVEAGSVGLAGPFTGVYPVGAPGGWQLIGRTPMPLFFPDREAFFTLRPGLNVRFKAISSNEFEQWS